MTTRRLVRIDALGLAQGRCDQDLVEFGGHFAWRGSASTQSIPAIRNSVPEHKVPVPAIDAVTASFAKLQGAMKTAPGAGKAAPAKPPK